MPTSRTTKKTTAATISSGSDMPAEKIESNSIQELIEQSNINQGSSLELDNRDNNPGELPNDLFRLTHLKILELRGFDISNQLHLLSKLPSLQKIVIRDCYIGYFPLELLDSQSLIALTISGLDEITELPIELNDCYTLTYLNTGDCGNISIINGLPPSLDYLFISGKSLSIIPEIIFSIHELTKLVLTDFVINHWPHSIINLINLESLCITNSIINNLPSELEELKNINELWLYKTNIDVLPPVVAKLKKLSHLILSGNHLSSLPDSLCNLTNLIRLDLTSNNFKEIPPVVFNLTNLEELELANYLYERGEVINHVPILPKQFLRLRKLRTLNLPEDKATNIPTGIISQGVDAIRSYLIQLESADKDYLFEAKLLILGEAGAGKTSLTWKLENSDCELPTQEDTTRGVDIRQYHFPVDAADFPEAIQPGEDRRFRLNLWDFGGQEIYKSTHRFFLSNQAVYLLVADSPNEDTDFAYWLHIQEIFGGKSPVLIIINERDERRRDLDEKVWKRLFGNIKEVRVVNLKEENKLRLTQLKAQLRSLAVELPHIGNPVPATWTIIRDALEADQRQRIEAHEYFDLCRVNGIADQKDARILSKYFHDIGVFLHFQEDELLKHIIFLKPTWATNAVYKVLDHPLLLEHNGRFSRQEAATIWQEDEFAQVQDELLKLMQKFFLTYKVSDTAGYIVPEKLPYNSPTYPWDEKNNLVLDYKYEYFMPRGLITQFIVQQHRYITNHDLVWRHGVVLARHDTVAEVIETYITRTIKVRIVGKYKRELMTLITEALDAINEQYANLKVEKYIPCNCSQCAVAEEPHVYEFSDLQTRLERGKRTIECRLSYEEVIVSALLHEVFNPAGLEHSKIEEALAILDKHTNKDMSAVKPGKIFISYAHEDKKYLDRLLKHFKVLEHEGVEVDPWSDKKLVAGMRWRDEIERAMQECKVAILLVSTDFLASNFIRQEELPTILESVTARGVTVLSVIVSPCRFSQTEFLKDYQAINAPSQPLSELKTADREKVYLALLDRVTALLSK